MAMRTLPSRSAVLAGRRHHACGDEAPSYGEKWHLPSAKLSVDDTVQTLNRQKKEQYKARFLLFQNMAFLDFF